MKLSSADPRPSSVTRPTPSPPPRDPGPGAYRGAWSHYGIAVGLALGTFVIRYAMEAPLHQRTPFLFSYLAVVAGALYLGTGPALLCLALCALNGLFVLQSGTEPALRLVSAVEFLPTPVFVGVGGLIVVLAGAQRASQVRAQRAARQAREHARRLEAEAAQRRQTEQELHASEERSASRSADAERGQRTLRRIAEATPDILQIYDLDSHRIVYANRELTRILGYTAEELAALDGAAADALIHPDDARALKGNRRRLDALAEGQTLEYEYRARHADGSWRWLRTRAVVFERGPDGRARQFLALAQDVTGRKETEEALAESQERLRLAGSAASVGIWTRELATDRVVWSPEMEALFGLPPGGGRGHRQDLLHFVHPADHPRVTDAVERAIAQKQEYEVEFRYTRTDGQVRWMVGRGRAFYDGSGRPLRMAGIAMDITARKSAENAMARLAAIVECSDDAIISKDLMGVVASWNGGAERIFGYTAEEMIGKSITVLIPPERVDEEEEILSRLRRGESIDHYETIRVTKDGRRIAVALTVSPLRDGSGQIVGASKIARDISERRQADEELARHRTRLEDLVRERTAELEASHERVRLSERMAALGTLSAGLGHDMGNLLLPIRARLDVLKSQALPEEVRADLEAIDTCTDYLQALSRGLRLFALDPADEAAGGVGGYTELTAWGRQAVPFFKSVLGKKIALQVQMPAGLPALGVAPHRLSQAVLNLMNNARDAIGEDTGTVTVSVAAEEGACDGPGGKGAVAVTVADDGPGMGPDVRARCLEPFFTTKVRAISTGLGLSLVRGIVERAGGSIRIDSAPEHGRRGTAITLVFKAVQGRQETGGTPARGAAAISVGDPRLAALASALLRGMGFEPRPAATVADPGACELWMLEPAPERLDGVRRFLAAEAGRRAIVVTAAGDGEAWSEAGAVVLRDGINPRSLRAALEAEDERVAELTEGQRDTVTQ
jgi:two-component system NtrC family sensor kinase